MEGRSPASFAIERHGGGTRRRVLAGGLAAAAAALVGPPLLAAPAPLRFGLTPVFLSSDIELLDGLEHYLERATGLAVSLVMRRTYQEITALLLSGQLDAAWICGFPYVQYRERLALLAVPLWRGRPLYRSYIIVGRDREVTRVEELRGDIHAFSDPDSNSGYLVTQALLVDMGETASDFFRETFFTYSHRNVVRAVAAGLAESGSVDGYVWEVVSEIEPSLTGATRVLRRSEWLGFPPIACAKALRHSQATRRIRAALLSMADDEEGRRVLAMLRLDGFTAGTPGLFEGIAQKFERVRSVG